MANNDNKVFPVHLHVYDFSTNFNRFLRLIGLGFYLTSVQVHGREYIFKAGEGEEPGIVSSERHPHPWYDGLNLQVSILIGQTTMDEDQVQFAIQELGNDYPQNSYNIFINNSNHFSNLLCRLITGNPIPSWVNRVTQFGVLCGCIMPECEVNAEVRRIALILADVQDPDNGNDDGDDDHDDNQGGDDHNDGNGDDDELDEEDISLSLIRSMMHRERGTAAHAETSGMKAFEDNNKSSSSSSYNDQFERGEILRNEDEDELNHRRHSF